VSFTEELFTTEAGESTEGAQRRISNLRFQIPNLCASSVSSPASVVKINLPYTQIHIEPLSLPNDISHQG
jgi:hypothetical protein